MEMTVRPFYICMQTATEKGRLASYPYKIEDWRRVNLFNRQSFLSKKTSKIHSFLLDGYFVMQQSYITAMTSDKTVNNLQL
jgi:hypothetical protein